jgi:hypothetical protein
MCLANSSLMPKVVDEMRKWPREMVGGILNIIVTNSAVDIWFIELEKNTILMRSE